MLQSLWFLDQIGIEPGSPCPLPELHKYRQPGVVPEEVGMDVANELARVSLRALGCQLRCCRFCRVDIEHSSVHLVHRQERSRHARCCLEELPTLDAQFLP